MGTLIKEKLYLKYLPLLAMSGFAPLSCLMKPITAIFQRFVATQRSTECTSVAGHSSQHNITQHGMLPQHPTGEKKLICDYF